ncbi:YggS family pyridoxal phosphate enzyme [Aspergillus lucknowensis]|uniref:Pyridoxal phosphate homeostasis protein n=1 Tax=Aspergillus lucknowensis TaxID=176173 RepID=A0ABR4LQM5_9EURO
MTSDMTSQEIMPPSPARTATLLAKLTSVTTRIATASTKLSVPKELDHKPAAVRLVAVSKLKPASDILALHNPPTSHLHFGENYLQELQEKARLLPATIKWHFIGGLQSNKCVSLARDTRGLWAVESVDSEKKATLLNKGWGEREKELGGEERLRVFVQVNTSGEENKSGVEPESGVVALCRFIREECPRLRLQGLMTIGAIARSKATTPENENEDFLCLREARERVVKTLGLEGDEAQLELSMGMSEDFEGAIVLGSDQVRVGTTIFGDRPPKGQARVV